MNRRRTVVTKESMDRLAAFITEQRLPDSYLQEVQSYFAPLAQRVASWAAELKRPLVLGINGAQGTGKSTLATLLALLLESEYKLKPAQFSIDDLYRTRSERNDLGKQIHPLLSTRGVPGTHDTHLGVQLIADLKGGRACHIPRFDKAEDDRYPQKHWQRVEGPVDVILFEGWCIGAIPEPAEDLAAPVNRLEESEDADGAWRSYVNHQLNQSYRELFGQIDKLVLIKAPDFESVYRWRREQEEKLAARVGVNAPGIMNSEQLSRFIMHYERLTRWMLGDMPGRSDVVLHLTPEHQIGKAEGVSP
jgi:D-glycerate 3-kinase